MTPSPSPRPPPSFLLLVSWPLLYFFVKICSAFLTVLCCIVQRFFARTHTQTYIPSYHLHAVSSRALLFFFFFDFPAHHHHHHHQPPPLPRLASPRLTPLPRLRLGYLPVANDTAHRPGGTQSFGSFIKSIRSFVLFTPRARSKCFVHDINEISIKFILSFLFSAHASVGISQRTGDVQ